MLLPSKVFSRNGMMGGLLSILTFNSVVVGEYSDIKPPEFAYNSNKGNTVRELHISSPCFDIRTLNQTSL